MEHAMRVYAPTSRDHMGEQIDRDPSADVVAAERAAALIAR